MITKFSGINVADKDIFTYIRGFCNSMFHTGMGYIEEVMDDGTVKVIMSYKDSTAITRVRCEYLVPSSAEIEISAPPQKDDIVFVISMQHKQDSLFTEAKAVEVRNKTGYNYLSCVCIPFGVVKDAAKTKIKADDGTLDVISDKIILNEGSDEKNAARNGDKVQVSIPAGTVIIAVSGGSGSPAVGTPNPVDIIVEGTIVEGSGTVFVGD
jgi:hypothetical protein